MIKDWKVKQLKLSQQALPKAAFGGAFYSQWFAYLSDDARARSPVFINPMGWQ
jgi:hypothetical protein